MKSDSRTLVSLGGAIIATFLTGAACAALPFKINSGHPRVYLNEARVAAIRSAAGAPVPLNGTAFPQVQGSIVLEILPRPKTGTSDFEPILDVYDPTRNHIFLRHADAETVGDDLGFQVAFDDNADNTPYVTAHQFTLTRDQWHILRISWNSIAKTATIQIDGETPINLAWRQSGGIPVEWRPDGQQFRLRGRDRLDNTRIYSSDILGPSTKVADFGMNEGSGVIALDSVSGNKLRISTGNYWVARGNGDYAIQMGSNAGIRVVAPSLLSEAWLDQRNSALVVANTLNGGGEPLSPKTVSNAHPDAITEVAKPLGLAWLVSGDPQFRAAGRVYADRLIDAPRNAGGEYAAAGRIEAMGLLYDWFFDSMGTDLRADSQSYRRALSAAILDTIRLPDLAAMICGGSRITLDPVWKCRSNDGSVAIVGPARGALGGHSREDNTKISAALFAIFDEHPENANLLAIEHRNFTNLYHPMRAWVGENGGSHMGWDYAATYNDLFAVLLWEKGSSVS